MASVVCFCVMGECKCLEKMTEKKRPCWRVEKMTEKKRHCWRAVNGQFGDTSIFSRIKDDKISVNGNGK